jgi:peptidyl-dipeptidase Dcp
MEALAGNAGSAAKVSLCTTRRQTDSAGAGRQDQHSKTFNQGFATVEYLAAAILDMKLHLPEIRRLTHARFEKEALAELGMPTRDRSASPSAAIPARLFQRRYSAGYYSYLWSDVITADVVRGVHRSRRPL